MVEYTEGKTYTEAEHQQLLKQKNFPKQAIVKWKVGNKKYRFTTKPDGTIAWEIPYKTTNAQVSDYEIKGSTQIENMLYEYAVSGSKGNLIQVFPCDNNGRKIEQTIMTSKTDDAGNRIPKYDENGNVITKPYPKFKFKPPKNKKQWETVNKKIEETFY